MIYIVTGAAGHLGNTIVKQLAARGEKLRCFVMPQEAHAAELPPDAEIFTGNVLDKASMEPLFRRDEGERLTLIHCAGIVSIVSGFQQSVYDVNVNGTKNVIDMCSEHKADRVIHVSSVHAIRELPMGQTITETKTFDPELVHGCYAKTKAEATAYALAAAANGLNLSVVHPSGICGPNDYGHGHITQLLIDYCKHNLSAGTATGGYDFVDVRDVAAGIIECCDRGRAGEPYILSNRFYSVRELLGIFHNVTGLKPVKTFMPMWLAKGTASLSEFYYKMRKQSPLYTPYSLYTLTSNAVFSHRKADEELGYSCRPMEDTIRDTYEWLKEKGRI